ncbi:hypothetical protein RFI_28242 [Reticulomyxa filosa]|uniref:PIPK domain-containing protein n=1 Tax=Reticulomyxa filosa TaxID=46433 RepID=X6M7Y9_RETFI|nr:hypothetical protein RFI_28242 [Reticulomyxa filosa]|eukprot:ETO09145.1 hypothetical protein RFI_28242 [Reticulomyxa filosa]
MKRFVLRASNRDDRLSELNISSILSEPCKLELMHNVLLGISITTMLSEKSVIEASKDELNLSKGLEKKPISYSFPSEGTPNTTPAHEMNPFVFEIYHPQIFAKLREHFGWGKTCGEYLKKLLYNTGSLEKDNQDEKKDNVSQNEQLSDPSNCTFLRIPRTREELPVKEFDVNSKSGNFFLTTKNGQLLIKSMLKVEFDSLNEILPSYYQHMMANKESLLPKYLGLFHWRQASYKTTSARNKKEERNIDFYLLITQSVFHPDIHSLSSFNVTTIYDLKGSTHGRRGTISNPQQDQPTSTVTNTLNTVNEEKKDNPQDKDKDNNTDSDKYQGKDNTPVIFKDLEWIDHKEKIQFTSTELKNLFLSVLKCDLEFLFSHNVMDYSLLIGLHFPRTVSSSSRPSITDFSSQPLKNKDDQEAKMTERKSLVSDHKCSYFYDVLGKKVFFVGIIDILQKYNNKKKLEHWLLGFKADQSQISTVEPERYKQRLC